MAIIFNDNLYLRANKHLDAKKGVYEAGEGRPFNTTTEFLTAVPIAYRVKGLTTQILKNGTLTEYWFRDGIADNQLIEKVVSTGDVRTSLIYSTLEDAPTSTIILAIELIDCDLSFFVAHRGVGTTLKGTDSPATDETVQVDTTTGEVTFLYPFTDFEEKIWFEYKVKASAEPPIPTGGFPYEFPMDFPS